MIFKQNSKPKRLILPLMKGVKNQKIRNKGGNILLINGIIIFCFLTLSCQASNPYTPWKTIKDSLGIKIEISFKLPNAICSAGSKPIKFKINQTGKSSIQGMNFNFTVPYFDCQGKRSEKKFIFDVGPNSFSGEQENLDFIVDGQKIISEGKDAFFSVQNKYPNQNPNQGNNGNSGNKNAPNNPVYIPPTNIATNSGSLKSSAGDVYVGGGIGRFGNNYFKYKSNDRTIQHYNLPSGGYNSVQNTYNGNYLIYIRIFTSNRFAIFGAFNYEYLNSESYRSNGDHFSINSNILHYFGGIEYNYITIDDIFKIGGGIYLGQQNETYTLDYQNTTKNISNPQEILTQKYTVGHIDFARLAISGKYYADVSIGYGNLGIFRFTFAYKIGK